MLPHVLKSLVVFGNDSIIRSSGKGGDLCWQLNRSPKYARYIAETRNLVRCYFWTVWYGKDQPLLIFVLMGSIESVHRWARGTGCTVRTIVVQDTAMMDKYRASWSAPPYNSAGLFNDSSCCRNSLCTGVVLSLSMEYTVTSRLYPATRCPCPGSNASLAEPVIVASTLSPHHYPA